MQEDEHLELECALEFGGRGHEEFEGTEYYCYDRMMRNHYQYNRDLSRN